MNENFWENDPVDSKTPAPKKAFWEQDPVDAPTEPAPVAQAAPIAQAAPASMQDKMAGLLTNSPFANGNGQPEIPPLIARPEYVNRWPETSYLRTPESGYTTGLADGQEVILSTDGKSQKIAKWNAKANAFQLDYTEQAPGNGTATMIPMGGSMPYYVPPTTVTKTMNISPEEVIGYTNAADKVDTAKVALARSLGPTAAGFAGFAGGSALTAGALALAPETLGASLIPLIGGAIAGFGTTTAASALQDKIWPIDKEQQLALDSNPTTAGVAGFLPAFVASPASPRTYLNLASKTPGVAAKAATQLGSNAAMMGALGTGNDVGGNLVAGRGAFENIGLGSVLHHAGTGLVLGHPNKLGRVMEAPGRIAANATLKPFGKGAYAPQPKPSSVSDLEAAAAEVEAQDQAQPAAPQAGAPAPAPAAPQVDVPPRPRWSMSDGQTQEATLDFVRRAQEWDAQYKDTHWEDGRPKQTQAPTAPAAPAARPEGYVEPRPTYDERFKGRGRAGINEYLAAEKAWDEKYKDTHFGLDGSPKNRKAPAAATEAPAPAPEATERPAPADTKKPNPNLYDTTVADLGERIRFIKGELARRQGEVDAEARAGRANPEGVARVERLKKALSEAEGAMERFKDRNAPRSELPPPAKEPSTAEVLAQKKTVFDKVSRQLEAANRSQRSMKGGDEQIALLEAEHERASNEYEEALAAHEQAQAGPRQTPPPLAPPAAGTPAAPTPKTPVAPAPTRKPEPPGIVSAREQLAKLEASGKADSNQAKARRKYIRKWEKDNGLPYSVELNAPKPEAAPAAPAPVAAKPVAPTAKPVQSTPVAEQPNLRNPAENTAPESPQAEAAKPAPGGKTYNIPGEGEVSERRYLEHLIEIRDWNKQYNTSEGRKINDKLMRDLAKKYGVDIEAEAKRLAEQKANEPDPVEGDFGDDGWAQMEENGRFHTNSEGTGLIQEVDGVFEIYKTDGKKRERVGVADTLEQAKEIFAEEGGSPEVGVVRDEGFTPDEVNQLKDLGLKSMKKQLADMEAAGRGDSKQAQKLRESIATREKLMAEAEQAKNQPKEDPETESSTDFDPNGAKNIWYTGDDHFIVEGQNGIRKGVSYEEVKRDMPQLLGEADRLKVGGEDRHPVEEDGRTPLSKNGKKVMEDLAKEKADAEKQLSALEASGKDTKSAETQMRRLRKKIAELDESINDNDPFWRRNNADSWNAQAERARQIREARKDPTAKTIEVDPYEADSVEQHAKRTSEQNGNEPYVVIDEKTESGASFSKKRILYRDRIETFFDLGNGKSISVTKPATLAEIAKAYGKSETWERRSNNNDFFWKNEQANKGQKPAKKNAEKEESPEDLQRRIDELEQDAENMEESDPEGADELRIEASRLQDKLDAMESAEAPKQGENESAPINVEDGFTVEHKKGKELESKPHKGMQKFLGKNDALEVKDANGKVIGESILLGDDTHSTYWGVEWRNEGGSRKYGDHDTPGLPKKKAVEIEREALRQTLERAVERAKNNKKSDGTLELRMDQELVDMLGLPRNASAADIARAFKKQFGYDMVDAWFPLASGQEGTTGSTRPGAFVVDLRVKDVSAKHGSFTENRIDPTDGEQYVKQDTAFKDLYSGKEPNPPQLRDAPKQKSGVSKMDGEQLFAELDRMGEEKFKGGMKEMNQVIDRIEEMFPGSKKRIMDRAKEQQNDDSAGAIDMYVRSELNAQMRKAGRGDAPKPKNKKQAPESEGQRKGRGEIDSELIAYLKDTSDGEIDRGNGFKSHSVRQTLQKIVDLGGQFSDVAKALLQAEKGAGLEARTRYERNSNRIDGDAEYDAESDVAVYRGKLEDSFKNGGSSVEEAILEESIHALTVRNLPESLVTNVRVPEGLGGGTFGDVQGRSKQNTLEHAKWYAKNGKDADARVLADAFVRANEQFKTGKYGDGNKLAPASDRSRFSIKYRLQNFEEFMVGVLMDDHFQKFMASIKVNETGGSMLSRIGESIKKLFGFSEASMDTLLGRSIKASENLALKARDPGRNGYYGGTGKPDFIDEAVWQKEMDRRNKRSMRSPQSEGIEKWADDTIREGKKRLNSGLDPELLAAYAVKGSVKFARSLKDFTEFSREMVKEFGDGIKPHLKAIFEKAKDPNLAKEYAEREQARIAANKPERDLVAEASKMAEVRAEEREQSKEMAEGRRPELSAGGKKWRSIVDHPFVAYFKPLSMRMRTVADLNPQSETAQKVVNDFSLIPGTKETGPDFNTDSANQRNIFYNKFSQALGPVLDDIRRMKPDELAKFSDLFIKAVEGRLPREVGGTTGEAVKKFRKVMDELHQYGVDSGMEIGKVTNYFPREILADLVVKDRAGFEKAAARAYEMQWERLQKEGLQTKSIDPQTKKPIITQQGEFGFADGQTQRPDFKEMARKWADAIELGQEGLDFERGIFEDGNPATQENFQKKREFTKEEAAEFDAFRDKDFESILSKHVGSMVRRAEITRRLGADGMKWAEVASKMNKEGVSAEHINELKTAIQSNLSITADRLSDKGAGALDVYNLISTSAYLKLTGLLNLAEPASIGMRQGDPVAAATSMFTNAARVRNVLTRLSPAQSKAVKTEIERIYGKGHDLASALAIELGINQINHGLGSISSGYHADGGSDRTGGVRRLNDNVYRMYGIHATEIAKRETSLNHGMQFIEKSVQFMEGSSNLQRIFKTIGKEVKADTLAKDRIMELGVKEADVPAFTEFAKSLRGLDGDAQLKKIMGDEPMAAQYRKALTIFNKQSSVQATKASRTQSSNDSAFGRLLFQFATFTNEWSAQHGRYMVETSKKVLKNPGNRYTATERLLAAGAAPAYAVAIAGMYGIRSITQLLTGFEFDDKGAPAWVKKAADSVVYTGILGPAEILYKAAIREQLPMGVLGEWAKNALQTYGRLKENPESDAAQRAATKMGYRSAVVPAAVGAMAAVAPNPVTAVASQVVANNRVENAIADAVAGNDNTRGAPRNPRRPAPPGPPNR